jgi:hypothetical protein
METDGGAGQGLSFERLKDSSHPVWSETTSQQLMNCTAFVVDSRRESLRSTQEQVIYDGDVT